MSELKTSSKIVVVDSRQRDNKQYPTPSFYRLSVGDVFKNVTSVELRGVLIPKSSYNIHSSNNKIDFAIGDSITVIKITNSGNGYTSPPIIRISSPDTGTTATASAFINASGQITNIQITNNGSGYSPGKLPAITIDGQARAVVVVGTHYTAVLREGEYVIGGNPIPPSTAPSGLILEIQNAMNYAVNGGNYDPYSTAPFAFRIVSQYPQINAVAGTPQAFDTNSCKFNRIQGINVNNSVWEFLWGSGINKGSANSVLGFNLSDSGTGTTITAINTGGGELIPAGTAIRGSYDYNLLNDPDFVIMNIELGDENMDRITSLDQSINHQFAALIFDCNSPETLQDLSGTATNVGGNDYLEGPTGKGTFWRETGRMKPIKGYDYDLKKYIFGTPKGKVSNILIEFTKFGTDAGGAPRHYDFGGREHTLVFEINVMERNL